MSVMVHGSGRLWRTSSQLARPEWHYGRARAAGTSSTPPCLACETSPLDAWARGGRDKRREKRDESPETRDEGPEVSRLQDPSDQGWPRLAHVATGEAICGDAGGCPFVRRSWSSCLSCCPSTAPRRCHGRPARVAAWCHRSPHQGWP